MRRLGGDVEGAGVAAGAQGAGTSPPRGLECFTDLPLAIAVGAAGALLRRVGPERGYRFARLAGDLWHGFAPRRRRIALRNLEIAFGEALSRSEREEIARESYRHAMATAVGAFLGDQVITTESLAPRFSSSAHLEDLLVRPHPRGLVLLSAHLGDWEMGQHYFAIRGLPVAAVARRIHNPHLDRMITRLRSCLGASVIPKEGGLRGAWKVLRSGGAVALMTDQSAPPGERCFEFFGVRSSTYFHYARFLARVKPEVAFVVCVREGFSFRFRVVSRDLTGALYGSGGEEERAASLVREYLVALEEAIRAWPEQYLWMHRRFKNRPAGATDLYGRLGEPLDPALLEKESGVRGRWRHPVYTESLPLSPAARRQPPAVTQPPAEPS
jgi:KDO2-lipid IV(A) lauroyltransferase